MEDSWSRKVWQCYFCVHLTNLFGTTTGAVAGSPLRRHISSVNSKCSFCHAGDDATVVHQGPEGTRCTPPATLRVGIYLLVCCLPGPASARQPPPLPALSTPAATARLLGCRLRPCGAVARRPCLCGTSRCARHLGSRGRRQPAHPPGRRHRFCRRRWAAQAPCGSLWWIL